jgi:hypothetical protein
MNQTLQLIMALVERQEVLISEHGYDELAADDILVRDLMAGIRDAVVVEDYPDYHTGPCACLTERSPRETDPRGVGYSEACYSSCGRCDSL